MSSRAASFVVWTLWLAMTVAAFAYVVVYGSRMLFLDDLSIVDAMRWGTEDLLERLWIQHNEHRIPLPRAILWPLYAWTHDIRAGSFVSIAALSGTSAAMIALARRLRGRTSLADAFFPLVWMCTGNCENLLMGFQIALMLPTACVSAIVLVGLRDGAAIAPRAAWLCAACLVALPLCGGPGMLQAPPMGAWLALVAWNRLRSPDARARRAGKVLAAGVVVTAVVVVLYMVDFAMPQTTEVARSPWRMLDVAARVLALALGQAAEPWWPASGVFVVLVAASAAALALREWREPGEQRWRATAVLFGLATTTALALGIGFGRSSDQGTPGFANRYVELTAPLLTTSYFAWLLFGRALAASIVHFVLCGVLLAADVLVNVPVGTAYGVLRRDAAAAFERDVEAGEPVGALARRHAAELDPELPRLLGILSTMVELELPPFDRYPPHARASAAWPMLRVVPSAVEGELEPAPRRVQGDLVLMVPEGTALVFGVASDDTKLVSDFGALDAAWQRGQCAPARLVVEALDAAGARTVLFERTLDPERNEADRGPQRLALELVAPRPLRVAVGVRAGDEHAESRAWLWLGDTALE